MKFPSVLTRNLRARPLFCFALCFLVGVSAAARAYIPLWVSLAGAGAVVLLYFLIRIFGKKRVGACFIALGVFLGAMRMTAALDTRPEVETVYGQHIVGVIADDPYVEQDQDRLVCRLKDVTVNGEATGFDTRLYLRGDREALSDIRYVQTVDFTGHLYDPELPTNDGEFDFRSFLWQKGLAAYCTANLENCSVYGEGSGFLSGIYALRHTLGQNIDRFFPKNSTLVRALVLGDRESLPDELREEFSLSGVAHLLAISGLHISLIALALAFLLRQCMPKQAAFFLTLGAIVLYGFLIGFSPSILRAILMFGYDGFAEILGRPKDRFTKFAFALGILLIFEPLFVYNAGFVLSFSAVAGIILLDKPIHSLLTLPLALLKKPGKGAKVYSAVANAAAVTIAAQLGSLPGIAATYGTVPVLGILTNLVVIPLVTLALPIAFAGVFLGTLIPFIGIGIGCIGDVLFSLVTVLTRAGAALPLNSVSVEALPMWLCLIFLLIGVAASGLSKVKLSVRRFFVILLPLVFLFAPSLVPTDVHSGLRLVFLDAGQADASLIFAEERLFLVDVGLENTPMDEYLTAKGRTPDAIFISHAHDDHAGGLMEVLEVCEPATLYLPAGWYLTDIDDGILEAIDYAAGNGWAIEELAAGDGFMLSENVSLSVLGPDKNDLTDDANASSIIMHVQYGDASALFTGDLPTADEPGPMPDIDVLKVAHHGSNGSTSYVQLYSATPSVAVISVGEGNSYGHPSPLLLKRLETVGARIFRTDLVGQIEIDLMTDGTAHITTLLPMED